MQIAAMINATTEKVPATADLFPQNPVVTAAPTTAVGETEDEEGNGDKLRVVWIGIVKVVSGETSDPEIALKECEVVADTLELDDEELDEVTEDVD